MIINVGTTNPTKIAALTELLVSYPDLKNATVKPVEITSAVSEQPKSLDETVKGAIHRAKASFNDCKYSFGIESGLMTVPETKTGYMDVCVCAIYDGKEFHLGLSSAWEAPKEIVKHMVEDGLSMSDAAYKIGLTKNPKIGSAEGLIYVVTKGRLNRKEYTKEAIRTALIHIENYESKN